METLLLPFIVQHLTETDRLLLTWTDRCVYRAVSITSFTAIKCSITAVTCSLLQYQLALAFNISDRYRRPGPGSDSTEGRSTGAAVSPSLTEGGREQPGPVHFVTVQTQFGSVSAAELVPWVSVQTAAALQANVRMCSRGLGRWLPAGNVLLRGADRQQRAARLQLPR